MDPNAVCSVDTSRQRLQRAGWSLGETCFGATWQVDGSNGDVGQPYCLLPQTCAGLSVVRLFAATQAGSSIIVFPLCRCCKLESASRCL
jgi:hypothetical protein